MHFHFLYSIQCPSHFSFEYFKTKVLFTINNEHLLLEFCIKLSEYELMNKDAKYILFNRSNMWLVWQQLQQRLICST